MTKRILTALVLASSAGTALADVPPGKADSWMPPAGIPVLYGDGSGSGGLRSGGLVNFDFASAKSWDAQGDPSNEVHSFTIATTTPLSTISWRGTIATRGESWRSEAAILFNTPDPSQSFFFRMGAADGSSGTTTYSGSADLVAALGFAINPAGTWTLEFFETFDDIDDSIDADWSNIDLAFVPAPSTAAVMGFGLLGARRRRR